MNAIEGAGIRSILDRAADCCYVWVLVMKFYHRAAPVGCNFAMVLRECDYASPSLDKPECPHLKNGIPWFAKPAGRNRRKSLGQSLAVSVRDNNFHRSLRDLAEERFQAGAYRRPWIHRCHYYR